MVAGILGASRLISTVDARVLRLTANQMMAFRAERLASRIERRMTLDGGTEETLSALGAMARSSAELERHLAPSNRKVVDACSFLCRFGSLRSIATGRPMRLLTSVPAVTLGADFARCIALAICDLIEVVELSQTAPPDLMLALEERDGDLVVALAAIGGDDHPVPTGEGAAALRRAETLVETAGGGLVRGVRNGMLLVGISLPVRSTDHDPSAPGGR